jgi:cytosine permease
MVSDTRAVRTQRPHWLGRTGPYVGIGASPAALILGAQLADRHDAPLAIIALVVSATGMLALLIWQGRLGVTPPGGEGVRFGELAPRYFDGGAARLISCVLAAAMIGWMGFNAGLGGAALAELAGLPQALTSSLVLVGVSALALTGLRWWNWLALGATVATLVLIVTVLSLIDVSSSPFTFEPPAPARLLTNITALTGYVAVFALRSPDFTAGLQRRSDVVWPAALLVGITIGVAAAGVAVWSVSGDSDVIGVIADRVSVGNLLLLLAVVPAALTSFHSGRLALASGTRLPNRSAALVVAGAGLMLAILRFDQYLVVWLAVLSVVLVPIMVPMGREVWGRGRGRAPRPVPTWTWVPASVVGAVGVLTGWHLALAAAAALAMLLTIAAARVDRVMAEDVRPVRGRQAP